MGLYEVVSNLNTIQIVLQTITVNIHVTLHADTYATQLINLIGCRGVALFVVL